MKKYNLDDKNRKILEILQEDAKISIKEIAQRIDLSFTPTYERIKQLEEAGVIMGYMAIINRQKVGLKVSSFCNVTLKEQSKKALVEFEKAVLNVPSIVEILSVSGDYDYTLKILSTDIENYNQFMVEIMSNIPHIGHYNSSIILSEVQRETIINIPDLDED